jgi:NADP-dependent 3-hydroxy acid dehydrogenase YdfG
MGADVAISCLSEDEDARDTAALVEKAGRRAVLIPGDLTRREHCLAVVTTKGAIANFTAGLAQMLGDRGIRVNAVAPGPIWTPLIPSTMPPEQVAEFGKNTPLASDEASYISGAVIPVAGGKPIH